jgi:hypothetical protein
VASSCVVQANAGDAAAAAAASRLRFVVGDWPACDALFRGEERQFDVILSSETIYSVANYAALCGLLSRRLRPDGVAVMANKRFYFGVGGGTRAFASAAEAVGLRCDVVQVLEDRGSNIREVMTVRHAAAPV